MKHSIKVVDQVKTLEKEVTPTPLEAMKRIAPFYEALNEVAKVLAPTFGFSEKVAFIALRDVITTFIFLDGVYDKEEYDYYVAYCQMAHFKPKKAEELPKAANVDEDRLAAEIELVKAFRAHLNDDRVYEEFTSALWILVGIDRTLSEGEYDLLILFYDPAIDKIPASYKAFLKERA
jgi:hypothetical protein